MILSSTAIATDLQNAPFAFCKMETGVEYGGSRSSINSRACYKGAVYITNFPESTPKMSQDFCNENYSNRNICMQAIWSYHRAKKGELTIYNKAIEFCEKELGFWRGYRWSLNSISCFFAVDYIESHAEELDQVDTKAIESVCTDRICLQAIWAYQREKRGASAKFTKTESYCTALTGSKRGARSSVKGLDILDFNDCYFALDFIENTPKASQDEINHYRRYADGLRKLYDKIINFYSSLP